MGWKYMAKKENWEKKKKADGKNERHKWEEILEEEIWHGKEVMVEKEGE